MQDTVLDYEALRRRLTEETGPAYWRSLDELTKLDEFDEVVHREFPATVTDRLDPVSRRNFMKLMGASMMLAGLASCARQPDESIMPYVEQPEEAIPGLPLHFATAMPLSGYGVGVLATSHMYRPTKLDGLKEHPSSLGASDCYTQAAILNLYDPDRLDGVLHRGVMATWRAFVSGAAAATRALEPAGGEGLRILTGSVTSPTLAAQLRALRAKFPNMQWHQYEPVNRDNVRAGAVLAFGKPVETVYRLDDAEVILALDADFLSRGPGRIRYTREFANGRAARLDGDHRMSRVYAAECSPSLTGANADHKLNVRYAHVELLARVVARELGVQADVANGALDDKALPGAWSGFVEALVADLKAAGAKAAVIPGEDQPPAVHALAHAINEKLGAAGSTVTHLAPVEAEPVDQLTSLKALAADMRDGKVETLVILGMNPAYAAPADVDFAGALEAMRDKTCIHLTQSANETSRLCHWVVPEAHFLEAWSDLRGHDGAASIVQPLIKPLFKGKSAHEVLEALEGRDTDGLDIVRAYWESERGAEQFDQFWKVALTTGLIPGAASETENVSFAGAIPAHELPDTSGVDIVFRPDPGVYDGSFNNNGWLQEIPRPLTKLVWDNAIIMSRKTAAQWHVEDEDLVELTVNGRTVRGPVFRQLGHPDGTVTVHLGYGRARTGRVGTGTGFNAYAVMDSAAPYCARNVSIERLGRKYKLSRTEDHHLIEQSIAAKKRYLVRDATLAVFKDHPDFPKHMGHHAPDEDFTLYDPAEKRWDGYKWGMTIDLQRCTGCNACTAACQAENNIPVVGKDQVALGREMHWIRVDRYYKANGPEEFDNPMVVHQPLPCMQCENAPCEPVCPVGATMHSKEGLNDMVYNRCIGTRYCANNCPYKVRRFNFLHWHVEKPNVAEPTLKMLRNPNVTVRSRGVMEKCTYCVQRINRARVDASRERRRIRDGEVVVACQSACPAGAIQFGDMNDPESAISKMKANPRDYLLLGDVGTRPRTSYLARVTNPSDKLNGAHAAHGEQG